MKNPKSFFALVVGLLAISAVIFGGVVMPLQEDSQLAQASVKRRTVDTTVCQSVVNKGTTQVQRNAVFGLCVSAPQRTGLTTTRFFSTPIFSRKHNTSFNYVVSIRNTSGAALTNFSLENVIPEGYVINHAVVNYQKGTFNIGTRTVSVPRVSRIRSVIVYLNVDLPQSSCDVLSTAQRAELNAFDICGDTGDVELGPCHSTPVSYNASGCSYTNSDCQVIHGTATQTEVQNACDQYTYAPDYYTCATNKCKNSALTGPGGDETGTGTGAGIDRGGVVSPAPGGTTGAGTNPQR